MMIEILDEDPAGPLDLPFGGPAVIVLVQEWPRLADSLSRASPDLESEIAALRLAAESEDPEIEQGTAEELLRLVAAPLDPLRDPLGETAWLQRRAVVALHDRFGLEAVLKGTERTRPLLFAYLAARTKMDKSTRESLAAALEDAIARGLATDPASSADTAGWLLR